MWRVKWFCSVFFMMSILTASEKSLGGVQFCGTAPIGLLAVGFVQYSHNCVCVCLVIQCRELGNQTLDLRKVKLNKLFHYWFHWIRLLGS